MSLVLLDLLPLSGGCVIGMPTHNDGLKERSDYCLSALRTVAMSSSDKVVQPTDMLSPSIST